LLVNVITAADQNTLQHEELLVGNEDGSDELVVAEYLNVDADECGEQEQMKEQHEHRAACRRVVLPSCQHDEEYVQKDDCNTADEPDHHEFVQLHAPVCHSVKLEAGPDFAGAWGARGTNIEDGSSLIIHWSSGSHKRLTN